MTTRRERSKALARCAPALPEELPAQVRGKPLPLSRIVEPYVEARYKDDPEWRAKAGSVNPANSPNGRVCFDDKDMAEAIKADATKNHGSPRIINAVIAELSTAIKRCMSRRGVGRSQRIAEAKSALLLSGSPAE
jgi:hypothetical protein